MNPEERLDRLLEELLGMSTNDAIQHPINQESFLDQTPVMQRELTKVINAQSEWDDTDPNSFTIHVQEHWDHAVQQKIQSVIPALHPDKHKRLAFLYQHHSFFKNTLTKVIQKKRAHQEAETKALWVINTYQNYALTGSLPTNEEFLLQQYMFGTPQQWMDLCDSLQDLYEGEPSAYIQHMIALTS